SSSFRRVHCCMSSTRYRRCTCTTSCTSTPGSSSATNTLITSSSRGGDEKSGGVRSHWLSSSAPSCVMWKPFWGPSSLVSSDSTSPSRSRRCSVVYTWPTLSGHTSPVRASNSCRSCSPYLGPSLRRANRAWRTLMGGPFEVEYSVSYTQDHRFTRGQLHKGRQ